MKNATRKSLPSGGSFHLSTSREFPSNVRNASAHATCQLSLGTPSCAWLKSPVENRPSRFSTSASTKTVEESCCRHCSSARIRSCQIHFATTPPEYDPRRTKDIRIRCQNYILKKH